MKICSLYFLKKNVTNGITTKCSPILPVIIPLKNKIWHHKVGVLFDNHKSDCRSNWMTQCFLTNSKSLIIEKLPGNNNFVLNLINKGGRIACKWLLSFFENCQQR